jgi:hypothetical protein
MNTHLDLATSSGAAWRLGALMKHRLLRSMLKSVLGVAATGVVAVTGAAIYNAIDPDLSPQAKALLVPPPMGEIDDSNGYVAFLGLVAPAGQDQMQWGRKAAVALAEQSAPGFTRSPEWREATRPHLTVNTKTWCMPDCLAEAKRDPATVAARLANGTNAQLLARYRKLRQAPDFADLDFGALNTGASAAYSALNAGASLSIGDVALKANAGDAATAIGELEQELKFHRRLVSSGRTLATVMTGETLLGRDLLAISQLLASDAKRFAPFVASLRELTRTELNADGITAALRWTTHERVSWAQQWQTLMALGGLSSTNFIMSRFIQPNATANLVADVMSAEASLAAVPATQFERERAAVRKANDALLERPWYAEASNPVGKSLAELGTSGLGEYVARFHDLRALARMVDLQLAVAERGLADSAATATFVAGEGAKSHLDPYTGRPFAFDPATRLLSFDPRGESRWNTDLKSRHAGRIAIEI